MRSGYVAFALVSLSIAASNGVAGTHIGNITLRTFDDNAPLVVMNAEHTPRLALRACGAQQPTLIDAEYDSAGKPYFPLDSDLGSICQVGLSLGTPLDIEVAGYSIASVSPAPIGITIASTPVADLVGKTIRVGTSTMMSDARAIGAVPRQATSGEATAIESALSVVTLTD
jgi:hypothetical protein